ncbi:hypothetical protein BKA70DRAFT_1225328 [Coprinopsis sp. MPI-PUGE-AT-0042]|nr:hypothetical protein BKA70DRAFT_1225328 [Coprinopsis sp. MPI-PUGE-AT-0042]
MNQENKISDPDTSELRPETLGNLYRYTRDTKGTRTPKPELPELPEIKTPKGGTWGIKNSDQRTQKNQISDVRSFRNIKKSKLRPDHLGGQDLHNRYISRIKIFAQATQKNPQL